MGSCPAAWLDTGEVALGFEALRDDLIRGSAVEHALAAGVVGSVESAQELLQVTVRVDRNAEHLPADSTMKALHPAIGLWAVGFPMTILRAEFGTSLGEGGRKSPTVVSQHMAKTERKGHSGLPQKSDCALLGLVILNC